MEGLGQPTPLARLVSDRLQGDYFTLIDIGCSSGLDETWRLFGDRLRAIGFDPNMQEVARLRAAETAPHVDYVAAFVGVSPGTRDAELLAARHWHTRNPWSRLSVARTTTLNAERMAASDNATKTLNNAWDQVELADPAHPVAVPHYLRQHGVTDVDFIKIDVDGPDFLILRDLAPMLASANVLGLAVEVNFHGSDDPDSHTLCNMDRLLKGAGFELFNLSTRRYSTSALPSPYALTIPAQTQSGRLLQGDAIYVRDAASAEFTAWGQQAGTAKLCKLAALFSLLNLPDCAAEIIQTYRDAIAERIDPDQALDLLVQQCTLPGEPPMRYADYIADFERGGARFFPACSPG